MNEQVTLQKALFTIKKLKHLLQEQSGSASEPIAIVGLSCRFPQAPHKEAYWKLLCDGKNVISHLPNERWNLLNHTIEERRRDPSHPYWGGYLENAGLFDPYFFGISPREAIRMDPQHRLLLEVTHEAIEDAGFPLESMAGSNTGVFTSLDISQLAHMQEMDSELDALYLPTGNAISIAANRISYLFDLRGPSIILDSACSSSMSALHIACLNLKNNLCDIALVSAAKLNLLPYVNLVLSKAKMLSLDGQCKTFDANANGYVQGEGVGVLVLKPLNKALQDNDRIYAVISGSALNQDGKTNGLTAPNGLQQEKLLKTAYEQAKVNPHDISYIECHGTGTFLGDPIEIQALGEVIGKTRDKQKPCWIGSVKTNIGHLEPAAGVASVIKVALALKNAQIPPHLNFTTPNPHIAFDKYRLRIPLQMESWPKYGPYRVAGLSGFGFGGTNAHIVMRELSQEEKTLTTIPNHLPTEIFTVSAKDPIALKNLIINWHAYLQNDPTLELERICHNVHLRRSHHANRVAILADTTAELFESLHQLKDISLETFENTSRIFINLKKNTTRMSDTSDIALLKKDPAKLALLYVNRAAINWHQYEETRRYALLDMPLYPWQHKDYWPLLTHESVSKEKTINAYPLQGRKIDSPLNTLQFEFIINAKNIPDIKDTYHVLHAGYYLELFAFAINNISEQTSFTVEQLSFLSPLIVPDKENISVQLVLEQSDNPIMPFHVYSQTQGQHHWVEHANGTLAVGASLNNHITTIDEIKNRSLSQQPAEKLYNKVIAMGLPAGDSIRWTHQYWLGQEEVLCEFLQPKTERKNQEFILNIHPGIMDGSIQPSFILLPEDNVNPYIASNMGRIKYFGMKPGQLFLLISLNEFLGEKMIYNAHLMNQAGEMIAECENVCLTRLDTKFEIQSFMQSNATQHIDINTIPHHERESVIIDFLTNQIANLFSMPKADISLNHSLSNMGMDSLMALVLMKSIEKNLGYSYSMQDLLQGPTIAELTNTIMNARKTEVSNPWIAYRERRPHAKIRLFCFPYGGGGASIYREWQKQLPDSIEVCPIQLPGRENRIDEKPIADIQELVNTLIHELKPEMDKPFAFFGHSFGSLIAFELGRQLRKQNMREPIHLFASAFPDPRVPTKSLDTILKQLSDINLNLFELDQKALILLSDEQLSGVSRVFSENGITSYSDYGLDKDIVKILLPIFIGDMSLVKSYEYYHDLPLNLPISVFIGKQDDWVLPEDHMSWGDHTGVSCEFHEFDSGHLFIRDNEIKDDVLQKIVKALGV